jgi:hypothetical protein
VIAHAMVINPPGFAVLHLDEMLRHLKKDYDARWYGEKKGP